MTARPPRRPPASGGAAAEEEAPEKDSGSVPGRNEPAAGPWDAPVAVVGDMALFHEAMRDVKPLSGRNVRSPAASAPSPPPSPPAAPAGPAAPAAPKRVQPPVARPRWEDPRPMPRLSPGDTGNLGRRESRAFLAGEVAIESRLDLHGMRSREARRAVDAFLAAQLKRGSRCIEIVTGTGADRDGGGVLQRAVPEWLDASQHRRQIRAIAFAPAGRRKGGNEGALRILLKGVRGGAGARARSRD